MSKWYSK